MNRTDKAVLIIEYPVQCGDCHLCKSVHEKDGNLICGYSGYYVKFNEKPNNCPLKHLLKRNKDAYISNEDLEIITHDYNAEMEYRLGQRIGWNACIEELEGKENE